ncbi:hypothetical protein WME99_50620 [Sorangium sp. So ce136]|uniref:hypothetical protein n=1 Tax=Sorangium sp. So ce136 TaxID=3133284 RepID=UPI003F0C0278
MLFSPPMNDFMALKGPMTTQSLRGMANHGPMHWRGDRTGGTSEPSAQPDEGTFDEREAFRQFQAGFVGLLGRSGPIPEPDMESFADFALQIMYPPNPIRNLDNALTADQQAGRDHFFSDGTDLSGSCVGCHVIDPDANAEYGEPLPGFFGSDGEYIRNEVPQIMKTPHLRNMYQKVGMFGMYPTPFIYPGADGFMGDQVRGFGFLNDGAMDTIFRFMSVVGFDSLFSPGGFDDSPGGNGDQRRRQVEQYMMAFESNLAPVVGQQVTLTPQNVALATQRVGLFIARAEQGECDLVAKARVAGDELGFLYVGADQFIAGRQALGAIARSTLLLLAQLPHRELTFTCVPPGSGARIAIDRDEDGIRDGDE